MPVSEFCDHRKFLDIACHDFRVYVVKLQGSDFWDEVRYLHRTNGEVEHHGAVLVITRSQWNDQLRVTSEFCKLFLDTDQLLTILQDSYDHRLPLHIAEKQPSMNTC